MRVNGSQEAKSARDSISNREITMAKDMEKLYQERLKRYVTAMRNKSPI